MLRRTATTTLGVVMLAAGALAGTAATTYAAAPAASHSPAAAAQTGPALFAKLSHAQATGKLRSAGISWSSSGGCSDRNNSTCTSFDQINSATVDGVITLKGATGCAVNLTGGTETGHAAGTYSHWNGYKVDFSLSSCLTNYITGTFASIGGSKWKSGSGNVYYKEGNHWDVTYYNCGGCLAADHG
ncbi:hypothetical protein ACIQNI_29580 [Streptomyces sp. NPDC091266]|uniref:hypothetical protein n=1 Tax=Streptomyces sp. NPDC091266 TaxID=3365978 RepID=UPI00381BBBAB